MDVSEIYELYSLNEFSNQIQDIFTDWNFNFFVWMEYILEGDFKNLWLQVSNTIQGLILNELSSVKTIIITLLMIGIISALFSNLSSVFKNHQIVDIAFYLNYLILIIFLEEVFRKTYSIVQETLNQITLFVQIAMPTYYTIVGLGYGTASAIAYYQITLFAIYLIECILKNVLLPIIAMYVFLVVLNGIWEENRLDKILELIKKGIGFINKILITMIVGGSIFQGMITPVIDGMKNTTISNLINSIPGIGNIAQTTIGVWYATATLVKNSVGILIVVLLIIFCLVPIIKLVCFSGILKIIAAILGMVSDKKIYECTNQFGDAIFMLLQILFTAITFFLILIGIVTFTTSRGFI
ncbi:MAG: stage III sporulation protein AE [Lachnospiraceae bacterium]